MSDNTCSSCNSKDSCSTQGSPSPSCAGSSAPMNQKELQEMMEKKALEKRMDKIKHKVLVFSGKGGVGKSTVSSTLARTLADRGFKVGILDIDFHGPSIPKLLGIEDESMQNNGHNLIPVEASKNLKVVSIANLLEERTDAVIWRGPMKMGVIQQLLRDVEWGELDFLFIDSPPGTGDEPLSICQTITADGAVLVTTPQQVAISDVRRSVSFCRKLKLPILGVVENMSGFVCPKCDELTHIFAQGGGEKMCLEMNLILLGSIPLDPAMMKACDDGENFVATNPESSTAKEFNKVIDSFLQENFPNTTPSK